ncbi:hypothetical protein BH24DEI2_BH24DEI2_28830 [soil metagenome]
MKSIPNETLTKILADLFAEAYTGPNHAYTWFINNEPGSGLLETLENVSAEDASSPQPSGSSIAAHTEHLRWSLAVANAFTRGETPQMNWAESWSVTTVDVDAWNKLRASLKSEYEALHQAIQQQQDVSDEQMLTALLAFTPHAAYHLGAIRQMVPFAALEQES